MTEYPENAKAFHELMNDVRKQKKVPLEKLCNGLCSLSMMHYIVTGQRLPGYRMRNRIMSRMGIPLERLEDYIQYDEFETYKDFVNLIISIENYDTNLAQKYISVLENKVNIEHRREYQELLDLKARVSMQQCEPLSNAFNIYKEAIEISVPFFEFEKIEDYVLAPAEYYLILKYMSVTNKLIDSDADITSQCDKYKKVMSSIKDSMLEGNGKARVYPMAVCGYFEIGRNVIANNYTLCKDLIEYIREAVEELRNVKRAYYLQELVNIKRWIYQLSKKNKWKDLIEENFIEKELSIVIDDLHERYKVNLNIEDSGYIYFDSEVSCISDIVKSRRKLYGLNVENMSKGICSELTLKRIESRKTKAQSEYIKALFERVGVNGDYSHGELLTTDLKKINIYSDYIKASNDNNRYEINEVVKELFKDVERNRWNLQLLIRVI